MKKKYIIPETLTTSIVEEQMVLTLSQDGGVDDDGNVVIGGNPGDGDGDDAATKRQFNVWDDDWSK